MARIVTLTLNPSIDKSTNIAALAPEKKLRCSEPYFDPGGGGINVARAIKKLGGEAAAIYPVGGYTGTFLNDLLKKESIDIRPIKVSAATRENLIVLEETTNNQYRFGMPGSPLTKEEWQQCLHAIEAEEDMEYLIASGSLPPGVPNEVFGELAALARRKGARFMADTSGEALIAAAKEGMFLLKPNLGELSSLVGREEIELEWVDDVAREIIAKGHCEMVAVSLGASGAMLITAEEVIQATPPPVRKRSTVGAGDSMVAGLVLALAEGKSNEEVLKMGVAAGTAATMNEGTQLCRLEDVNRLLPKLRVQVTKDL